MQRTGDIISILSLGLVAWQDFRTRLISGWLLVFVLAGLIISGIAQQSFSIVEKDALVNFGMLSANMVLLWLWLKLKHGKTAKIVDRFIGLGDLLFFVPMCVAFSPVNFLLFYVTTILLTLVTVIVFRKFSTGNSGIPLAGAFAIPLIALCVWRLIDPAQNFHSEEWLTGLINY